MRGETAGRYGTMQGVVDEKQGQEDIHHCINILGCEKVEAGNSAWLRRCKTACISTKIWGLDVQDTACGGVLASYTCRNIDMFVIQPPAPQCRHTPPCTYAR